MHRDKDFSPKKHFDCAACGKRFELVKLYQMFCSDKCEVEKNKIMHEIQENRLNNICVQCGLTFRRPDVRKGGNYCLPCFKQKQKENNKIYKAKTKESSADVKPEKSKRKKISYDELIRRSEYKRVMDDSGWNHYLKGRKWDKI